MRFIKTKEIMFKIKKNNVENEINIAKRVDYKLECESRREIT